MPKENYETAFSGLMRPKHFIFKPSAKKEMRAAAAEVEQIEGRGQIKVGN